MGEAINRVAQARTFLFQEMRVKNFCNRFRRLSVLPPEFIPSDQLGGQLLMLFFSGPGISISSVHLRRFKNFLLADVGRVIVAVLI